MSQLFLSALLLTAMVSGSSPAPAPLVCRLDALSEPEQRRLAELHERLGKTVREILELPNGFTLGLSGTDDSVREAAEFVLLERRCCPFLDFELKFESSGTVWLSLTGAPEAKRFLAEQLPRRP